MKTLFTPNAKQPRKHLAQVIGTILGGTKPTYLGAPSMAYQIGPVTLTRDWTVAWPAGLPGSARRAYDLPEIKRWLELFLKRFFANQFKRSAVPNGPKISSGGALSPRGDWRMPSDVTADAWLAELREGVPA